MLILFLILTYFVDLNYHIILLKLLKKKNNDMKQVQHYNYFLYYQKSFVVF